MAKRLGYARTTGSLLNAINDLLAEGRIEYIKGCAGSRSQKLRLVVNL